MKILRINSLAGVPILYDREPPSNYGVAGYPIRPHLETRFASAVDRAFQDIFLSLSASGVGDVTSILVGGTSGTSRGVAYSHRKTAFDLDGFMFAGGGIWAANSHTTQRFEYLLIEAHLRRAFGTVLTHGFDPRFGDHIHFDNGDAVGFRRHSKSRTFFLQSALRYLFDQPLETDGVYGPETQQVERHIRNELNIGGFSKKTNWDAFLLSSIETLEERISVPAVVKAFA
ncbi:hypothetical protein NBRC116594_38430 [Shimia sp. NS0008-38b]|uniref:hypothetical protein n=1 Tax=Shimia sp. NS0008-38b TaxID=3127653 RepID=UPI0031037142